MGKHSTQHASPKDQHNAPRNHAMGLSWTLVPEPFKRQRQGIEESSLGL